jgi:hypothetical protein
MQLFDQFANLLRTLASDARGDQRVNLAFGPGHGPRTQGYGPSPKTLVNPDVESRATVTAASQDFWPSEEGIAHLGTSLEISLQWIRDTGLSRNMSLRKIYKPLFYIGFF